MSTSATDDPSAAHQARPAPSSAAPLGAGTGFLLVDKPAGLSSHDVVAVVRRAARSRRVGHAGTLDPFATGLLVLAVGSSTRLLPYIAGEPKVYEATVRFGTETTTDDGTGEPSREAALPSADILLDPASPIRLAAEQQLTGPIAQVPPAFSAKHVDGQRAYDLARRGKDVVLAPVPVVVHAWEWLEGTDTTLRVRITCGGGTYIRALARDIGRLLGSAAHCESLRRVSSGEANVADAVPLSAVEPGVLVDGRVILRSPLAFLGEVAREVLQDDQRADLRYGRALRATQPGVRAALLDGDQVVAIAERAAGDRWQPRVVLLGAGNA